MKYYFFILEKGCLHLLHMKVYKQNFDDFNSNVSIIVFRSDVEYQMDSFRD